MNYDTKEYMEKLRTATDHAIEIESRDIKPNEKVKVSITVTEEGLIVNAKKVKK